LDKWISAWKELRSRYWLALGFDCAVIVLVMWGLHAWQTRALPINDPAFQTVLPILASGEISEAVQKGEAGIIYFFAPWCGYCRNSIDNLDQLVQDGEVRWASAIALSYSNPDEVRGFVSDTEIDLPVFLGTAQTSSDWGIQAFPTYFVIDATGAIHSRSVGYSTWLGIRLRNWMAQVREN